MSSHSLSLSCSFVSILFLFAIHISEANNSPNGVPLAVQHPERWKPSLLSSPLRSSQRPMQVRSPASLTSQPVLSAPSCCLTPHFVNHLGWPPSVAAEGPSWLVEEEGSKAGATGLQWEEAGIMGNGRGVEMMPLMLNCNNFNFITTTPLTAVFMGGGVWQKKLQRESWTRESWRTLALSGLL